MELKTRAHEKIRELLRRGVDIPNPLSLDVGDDVKTEQISTNGVRIYPGCRIYGEKTVISAGSRLGYEGPVTIENCLIGANVELKGGFFSHSVFLSKAGMGMGAHVREGCILEEEANGAHCVGLKQTILFPFVTLGSLVNFCDCLMAGGTSRRNHSEVGSSYIHFNFTPDADKTTPSLIGDVPRGVMLNQPPIFLGGQGGMVGPLRIGYGNVVAAGSILRQDYPGDNRLIFAPAPTGSVREFIPAAYPGLRRIIENNIIYLANVMALEAWYRHVRRAFFDAIEFGPLLYAGAMEQLHLARKERLKRLETMARNAAGQGMRPEKQESSGARGAIHTHFKSIEGVFGEGVCSEETERSRDAFLDVFQRAAVNCKNDYIEMIQNLSPEITARGVAWLAGLVGDYCKGAAAAAPALNLFGHGAIR